MRKNYPDLSNNAFVEVLLRNKLSKLFFFLGFLLLSLNFYGQDNAADPVPFVSANFPNLKVSKSSDGGCISIPIIGPFCSLSNEDGLIDASLTNFATARFGAVSIGATHSLRVTDSNTTFSAGTFAGFKIAPSSGLLSLNLLKGVTIKTYNNTVLQETFYGSSVLDLTLLPGLANDIVGFNSNKAFDAVEIVLDGGVALLSATNVYYAVIKQYTAGPALDCNMATKLSSPAFPVTAKAGVTGLVVLGGVSNVENAVSVNNSDFASINLGVGVAGSASIAIKDQVTTYPIGTYAGFEIENTGLLNVSVLGNVVVSTYLNGNPAENFSGSNLLANVGLLPSSGRFKLGFVSKEAFDEVRLTIGATVGLDLGTTRVYGAIFQKFCQTTEVLACNEKTAVTAPAYPVYVNSVNTGIDAVACVGCSITNQDNLIDADLNNYAELNVIAGVGSRASLSVKEQIANYPAGTFAGYIIENTALLNVGALGGIKITTYLDGEFQESKLGNDPLVSVGTDLLGGSGRQTVGFITTKSFDEVQITFGGLADVSLGEIKVYNAFFQKFCVGPVLACNVQTAVIAPTYPVFVNSVNSGIGGVACVGCAIVDQDNLIDTDLNNFAQINTTAGVISTGSLSVKNQITDYPAGTFAGYTIESPALLSVGAFEAITVTTYLDGVKKETKTGNGALVTVGTDLLVGTGKQTIGFVATTAFDEVQITFENLLSVNLGQVKVYNAVFQKLCAPVVECNENYVWSNPAFPVTIDSDKTGIDGVACVGCAVNDTGNLLTVSETDFANITLTAGVLASGSVAVKDELFTYPKGTFAGYVIRDRGTLAQVNLLQSLTINTYNDNVLQETSTTAQLIDLSLLGIDVLGSTPGVYNVGFKTTKPFDEIRLTVNSIASVINSIDVYGAFVNTSETEGGSGSGLDCTSPSSISLTKEGTYVDANADGIVNVGDRIDYAFNITNTGAAALKNVIVTDPDATVTGTPIVSLAAGANDATSYKASYMITQAGIDAGVVYNLATVTSRTNLGTVITATSTDPTPCTTCPVNPTCTNCTATPLVQTNTIALVKTATVTGTAVLGSVITYTFSVTNTGNTTLKNVIVTDPMSGLAISGSPIASLAPGVTNTSIKGTYIIKQVDVDAGKVINSAKVTAKDPKNNDVTDISGTTLTTDDKTETPVNQTHSIALVKTATVTGTAVLGSVITYTFSVTNTGNTTLKNVIVTDPMSGLAISGSPIASLAPGVTNTSIKGTYIIKQVDVDAGKVINSAKVTAKDPKNNDVTDISGTTLTTDDKTETPVNQTHSIALVKTATVTGTAVLGSVITYTFSVTNTGNTTLKNIIVTDPMSGLAISGSPIASLAPGVTNTSIKGTYIIKQVDVDAGKVINSAKVTAKDPKNNDVTDISGTTLATDDKTETPVTQTHSIALVKTATVTGTAVLGSVITYTFSVTNTGNTTLKNIIVTDPMSGLAISGSPIASLAPGVTNTSIKGTYIIKQVDVDAGKVINSAKVTAKDPKNNDVTDISGTTLATDDKTETPVTQTHSIALVKTATVTGTAVLGSVITYTFSVTNTGNTTLKNIIVTDPMSGLAISGSPIASLAPGVTNTSIKGTYIIKQVDVDAGKVINSAKVTAKDPKNNDVTDISGTTLTTDDKTETPVNQTHSIALVKTGSVVGEGKFDDEIIYTFAVTNTGTTTLTNVVITDVKVGSGITGNPIASLAPGATNISIKATYVITQPDVNAGKVTNTAKATAQDPQGNPVEDISGTTITTDDKTETPVGQRSTIALVKKAVIGGTGGLGETITYTFEVHNTGTTDLKNITITDPLIGLDNTNNSIAALAPGGVDATITRTYSITQADVDAGKVTNSAIVNGLDSLDKPVTDISGTTVGTNDATVTPLIQTPGIVVVKKGVYKGNSAKAKVGDKITYTFTVTNTGNVTLKDIFITDNNLALGKLDLVPSILAPLKKGEIEQDYTITQADIDAGVVTNTAIATGQDPQGNPIQDQSGTTVDNNTETVTDLPTKGLLAFVKTAVYNGNAAKAKVGDKITYTFKVTNTGNVTVKDIVINDAKLGATALALVPNTLLPNEFGILTKEYTITQADLDAKKVSNTAIATGQDPQGVDVTDQSGTTVDNDTETVTDLPTKGLLAFVKTAVYGGNAAKAKVGDKITYTFKVTNTGNVTVKDIVINDAKLGATALALVPNTLLPNEFGIVTREYTITQADLDAKKVSNTAIATGQDPQGVDVQDISGTTVDNDTETVTDLPTKGLLAFVKTAVYNGNAAKAKVGDKITYTFTVTNTGNVTVKDIVIKDVKLGATALALVPNTLLPNEFGIITKEYTITQADLDAKKVSNTAIATGQDPQGVDVTDQSGTTVDNDTETVTDLPTKGLLAFVKTAVYGGNAAKAKVGDKITYTFKVTNTGNVTVKDIVINDAKLGATALALVPNTLLPNEFGIVTREYTITQADLDAKKVSNTAIATGQDPQGVDVTDQSGTNVDNDTETVTDLPTKGLLAFVKTAVYGGNAAKAKVGDKITYTFKVTNTGNVTVKDIVINDAKLGETALALVPNTLLPNEFGIITKEYTITQADLDAKKVSNTAIATGQDPQGVDVTDQSGTTVDNNTETVTDLPTKGLLAFVKTAVYNGNAAKAKVGDKITYTFTVTNTGNVTVKDIVINDAKLGATALALVPNTLLPTETAAITREYTITQADLDAKKVSNTAIATGQDPQGVDVTDQSGTTVDNDTETVTDLPTKGVLSFVKTALYGGNAAKAKVGDKITYTFKVTNTGNVTVKDIVINDAKLGATALALVPNTLLPNEFGIITKEYTITQADLDAKKVSNTAIATGQDPQGVDVTDQSGTTVDNDTETVTDLPTKGLLAFVKTALYGGNAAKAKVGDKITYTFTVTNTGNVTVKDIVIKDVKLGETALALVPNTLLPNEFGIVTKEYTITQADLDAKKVSNTAIATGQDPQGVDVTDQSGTTVDNDTETVTDLPTKGLLAFVKTAVYGGNAAKAKVGDKITYTFTVTNTGNVTVKDIVINDAKLGATALALVPNTLLPNEFGIVTKEYTITQADLDAKKVSNTAIATGQDPQGVDVTDQSGTTVDNDTETVTDLPTKGLLAFVKTAVYGGNAAKAKVGDKITYTFKVTNTGNVTVKDIVIKDVKLGATALALVPGTLLPTETAAITREYTITQADIDIRKVTNTAIAKGQDPQGDDVQDISGTAVDNDDPTITDLPENAKIALMLKGVFQDENQDGQAQMGETIKYKYTIMNMGEVPLSNIWIEDEMVGHGMSEGSINLSIGAIDDTTFSSTYTLTQADIIAGNVSNQATVFGTTPLGKIVQDLSHDTSPLEDGFTVIAVDGCQLTIFNAVSPNSGTQYERIFYIRGLDCYPDNTVQIFDRWGVKVYEANGYDNNAKAFRGISEGRVTVSQSKGLANGTYFYVINYVDKDGKGANKSGYLHLIND